MKKNLMLFSFVCMTLLYGCGGSNSTGTAATSTSGTSAVTVVTQNGITSVAAPSNFIGTWTGYVDDDLTRIVISANGNITVTQAADTEQRLLVLQNNVYYIVNPTVKAGNPVSSNGTTLTITVNGSTETLSRSN